MSERFFIASLITGELVALDGPEAHHLAHVMRAQPGQTVTLFDGSGCEFVAEIKSIGKREVQFAVVERCEVDRESPIKLTLAVALPKGERQRWLIEKAVELGVAGLIPVQTERGVAQPSETALERLRRGVIEASKQCGRNRLMEIHPAQTWQELVSSSHEGAIRLIAHPDGTTLQNLVAKAASSTPIVAAVGPEGGFTEQEVAAALAAGWQSVNLGPRILRVETAAIALAAWAICR